MSEHASTEKKIGKPDGPTGYFILGGKNSKPTIKQRFQKWRFVKRKARVAKKITANPHTLDEVSEYIKTKLGFEELRQTSKVYQHEYQEMRAGFLMQHMPELLGDLQERPQLKGESEEDIRNFMDAVELRKQAAYQVPKEAFDIELRMFKKKMDDSEFHVLIEKKYEHIGGGASGSTKVVNRFRKVYGDIYRYYGVSEKDIAEKSKRYEDYLRQLAR